MTEDPRPPHLPPIESVQCCLGLLRIDQVCGEVGKGEMPSPCFERVCNRILDHLIYLSSGKVRQLPAEGCIRTTESRNFKLGGSRGCDHL